MSGENKVIEPLIRDLMEKAATGEAAKMFLQSGLGRHITERATHEVDEALEELIDADPYNAVLISAIQRRIRVASQAITWLAEAISEGDNALSQLSDE